MTDLLQIIDAPDQVVEVIEDQIGVVEVLIPGLPGKDGTVVSYEHQQIAPASIWVINHNLGFRPHVTVLSPGGAEVEASIVHISLNQARAMFAVATTGSARCL